jgi:hypothetical protein
MRRLFAIGVLCCLVLVSCAKPAEEPVAEVAAPEVVAEWLETSPEMMTETQRAQQELVLAATNAMVSELMGELMAAMEDGDASAAIGVCKEKAPAVAANISMQYGLAIGRTSHKLRNPANTAPDWAMEFVDGLVDTPSYVVGPKGELGALLPIKLAAECQMCHGPAEMIDEEVMASISTHYPDDQAVGFAEGDLRGWLWVEAPPGDTEVEPTEI